MWLLFYIIMDAVKEMKEWLFQKLQAATSQTGQEPKSFKGACAITPNNIPEFVIPGSNDSSRRTSECSAEHECCLDIKRNSYGGRSMHSSPPGSPLKLTPSESSPCMRMLKGNDLCNSAPVTPKHEIREIISCRNVGSLSVLDGTNDDPLSFAAMGLPHFRAQTSFGFSTLTEAPHTRRRESLFHANSGSLLQKKHSLRLLRQESLSKFHDHSTPDISTPPNDLLNCKFSHPNSSSMPSVIVTSFAQSSLPGSPSPEHSVPSVLSHRRLSPTYLAFQGMNHIPLPNKHNRFYNRRRSSLVNIVSMNDNDSDKSSMSGRSTPSQHSLDLSNEPQRRSLGEIVLPIPSSPCLKRHSAPQIIEQPETRRSGEIQKPRSSSCYVISRNKPTNHNQLFAPYGELKISFQYLAATRQLKLTFLKAENLGGQQKQDRNVNAFAKAYLMPGKIQKQTSAVVKRTKNPVFNQDIYFQNISLEELHSLTLKVKIFSKPNNLKMQEFIGEVSIPLDDYDVLVENRMWKDLESRRVNQELGYLGVGLMFDDVQGSVKIHIDQARQLPQHPITGPPDPYVRIEVTQGNRPVSKKQTTTQKKTANPAFEETFSVSIVTKQDDLDATTISLTMFDHERLRSDDVIGNVVLGSLATDVSQYGHWQEAIENAGEMIAKWHYLIDVDD